jgi:sortase (surface protein transpeptidase)
VPSVPASSSTWLRKLRFYVTIVALYIGSKALLYTDNGHIFSYTFADSASVGPHDVSVLNYAGPPELVIQTCTGSLDELRTMYHYNFDKVVQ